MKKAKILLILFMFITVSMNTGVYASSNRQWDLTLPSLKDSFAEHFYVGNIMEPMQAANESLTAMFKHHYNFVTAENAMKPSSMSREPGEYRFTRELEFFIDWAVENEINIVGHTLVWHSQSARWLTVAEDGGPLTRAEARANMEEYINAVAGHFAGKIHSWDVVNEAFVTSVSSGPVDENEEGWWKKRLRSQLADTENSPSWFAAYANGADEEAGEHGSDYIYDAFVFARKADPNAVLYYNDFNETDEGKRFAIAQMVEELNKKWETDPQNDEPGRLLIEGIGMQAHYWTANLVPATVELTIMRFAETGARVSITELDIPIGSYNNFGEATEENLRRQAQLYGELFEVFLRQSDKIERVTFWGKADNQSWRSRGFPLLFDGYFNAKPSFFSVIELAPEPSLPSDPDPEPDPDVTDPPEIPAPILEEDEDAETDSNTVIIVVAVVGGGLLILIGALILLNKRK